MKKVSFKIISFCLFASLLISSLDGYSQKKPAAKKPAAPAKKPAAASSNPFGGGSTSGGSSTTSNPFGGGGTTTQPPKAGGSTDPFAKPGGGAVDPFAPKPGAGNQPPANRPAGGNVPIVVVPSSGSNPLTDSFRASLRNPSAIISNIKDRNPLAYDDIREDDAIYTHKIWQIVDAREKINAPFVYGEDNGSQLFFTLLFKAITEDSVVAFEDDKFRRPYNDLNKFKTLFSGGVDTSDKFDLDNNLIGREVRTKDYPLDSIYQFQIMKEIVFDKEAARLVHRIIGIAPMGPTILPSGKIIDEPPHPLFWIYYPDVRKTLAKKSVYNPKNLGARMTWEDYLENQHFSYYIVKSSMDNVKDLKLKDYIKDPLFRLLEGDKIKEKIFSYEQGLWAY